MKINLTISSDYLKVSTKFFLELPAKISYSELISLTMLKFGLSILVYQLSLLQLILQNMNASELQVWKNPIIYVVTILLQEDKKNTKSVI